MGKKTKEEIKNYRKIISSSMIDGETSDGDIVAVGNRYNCNDFNIVANVIDRDYISNTKIYQKELMFNSIYFLVGNDKKTLDECIYVGQAKERNGKDGGVLHRLREHDKAVYEKYYDKWKKAIVVTAKDGTWGPTELSALENIFYHEIPAEERQNGNEPNKGIKIDIDEYAQKIEQIEIYLASLSVNAFVEKTKIQKKVEENFQFLNEAVENLNPTSKIPEIVTPTKVVDRMIKSLPDDVWNKNTVFLDPACKGGEYLKAIYNELLNKECMIAEFPDEDERKIHILSNQLFGIALSKFSYDRTKSSLKGFGNNIILIDDYINILKSKFDAIVDHNRKEVTFKKYIKQCFRRDDMEINVVIGNPPYQEKDDSGKDGGSALYDKFMQFGSRLVGENGIISFVIPMRWMVQYRVKGVDKDWVRSELECNKYRSLYYTDESKDLFNGVNIRGGIMYFIKQNGYNGKCSVINLRDKDDIQERYLKTPGVDIFIPNKLLESIVEKVKSKDTFDSIVGPTNEFGIESNTVCTGKGIRVYRSFGNMDECSRDFITKGIDKIDLYKVLIGRTFGKGVIGERLPETRLIGPGEVCTGSLLAVGKSKDRDYCLNVQKYMQTKFMSILVSVMKSTHHATREAYQLVPLQDFTQDSDIDWSKDVTGIDKQLYAKYKLTQLEIDYIEKTIS